MSHVTGAPEPSTRSPSPPSRPQSIPDSFRVVAAEHMDQLVYQDRQRSVTYAQFERESNSIANGLLNVLDDRPLAVVAPVSIDSLTVIYGALMTGRVIAPLDPRWPVEQWIEVVRRLDGRLVVPDPTTRDLLPGPIAAQTLVVSDLRSDDTAAPDIELNPDEPALVFFTSGSTGAPKGTLVGHGMSLRTLETFPDVGVGDRIPLLAPLSFISGATLAIGIALTGGTGLVYDAHVEDLNKLPDWLDEHEVTIVGLTPSLLALLAGGLNAVGRTVDSVRMIGLGGEAGSADDFAQIRRAFPNAQLYHMYGMTETGGVADYVVGSGDESGDGPMPVGHPRPNVRVEIVDDDGIPVSDGEAGELWVTGRDVAFGYWDEPALTAERFTHNADGTRTVHTGDRARLRHDGMLEILGRSDRRVKVNGQLVDLTEVEHEVELLPHVRDAVVSSVPTADGGYRVVAHVVLSKTTTVGELRRGLGGRLPQYAIPRAFFRVDEVPHTISGKADRVWLRESAIGALPLETEYVAPRSDIERAIASLFEEVLAVERVGVHDDFFELGGDSLSVVDLLAGLSEQLDLDLSPSQLLDGATVEAVSQRLVEPDATRHVASTIVQVNDGAGPPLFCVPGAADTPVQYRALGRRLPFVALHAFAYHGMDTRAVPDQTVDAIARRNVAAIEAMAGTGPYRLLGYSFGGAVALAMAQQLTARGHEIEWLALLEPSLGPPGGRSRVEQSRAFAGRVHRRAQESNPGGDLTARLARTRKLASAGLEYAKRQVYLASAGIVRRRGLAQHEVFFELHTRLLRAHDPKPYSGRALVFASPRFLDAVRPALDLLLPAESAGGHRRDVPIAGEHLDLVREPNVGEVARVLDAVLVDDPA